MINSDPLTPDQLEAARAALVELIGEPETPRSAMIRRRALARARRERARIAIQPDYPQPVDSSDPQAVQSAPRSNGETT